MDGGHRIIALIHIILVSTMSSEILQDRYYCPHFTEKEIECKQVNFLGSQREKKNDKTKI